MSMFGDYDLSQGIAEAQRRVAAKAPAVPVAPAVKAPAVKAVAAPRTPTAPTVNAIISEGTVTDADRARRAEELRRRDENRITQGTEPIGVVEGSPATQATSTFNRQSYRDIVSAELALYGLDTPELVEFIVSSLQEYDQIGPELFMAKIRGRPEYQQRFRGNELRRQAGLNVLNESQYIADETAYEAVLRNAGLPKGYYDSPDDFVAFIAGNVSPLELSSRITEGYLAVANSDQSVRDEMRRLYGLTDGEMVAYYLDPQKALPIIEREVATARVGASAARAGFSNVLDREALERFTALGVSEQQATEAFGFLGGARELLSPLDAGETSLDVADTALGLAGQSPEALQRLQTQRRRRQARFEGGGALATTAGGVTGLREA